MDFNAAVGQRARELRVEAGATQDQVARAMRRLGVDWTKARVTQLESGSTTAALPLLVVLGRALSWITGRELTLADLIPDEGFYEVGRFYVVSDTLRDHLNGRPLTEGFHVTPMPDWQDKPGWGAADDFALRELELVEEPVWLAVAGERLWGPGSTVTTERDRRAGPGATPQKRGRITRTLIDELRPVVVALVAEAGDEADPEPV